MAVGRISGPLLKSNLIRNGIDLAFETDLLYLDVNNQRIGIKTDQPTHELQVSGTTRTTNLLVDTEAKIADITITGNTISSDSSLNLLTTGSDTVVYQRQLDIQSISIYDNVIETNESNANLELRPNGSGIVEVFSSVEVDGNIHATGNITADGDIRLGSTDQTTPNNDTVTFNAEVASDLIPETDSAYTLGSSSQRWNDVWINSFNATNINTGDLFVDGIDLSLRQGNIIYVATNGDDAHTGTHPNDPVASIKYALETLATAGDTIHVYPGTYTEDFPLTIPVGVGVKGESLRSVTIQPTVATEYNDAFLLNGETTVEDLTVSGFYSGGNSFEVVSASAGSTTVNVGTAPFAHAYVSGGTINIAGTDYSITGATYTHTSGQLVVTHASGTATIGNDVFISNLTFSCNNDTRIFPDNGYAFRFATDFEVTTRSPYVKNITVITEGKVKTASDPRGFNSGDAGKGVYVDGAYATANSKEAAMLFHSVTFICPGVDGVTATNGARIEWLNSFTYFANRSMYAYDSNDGIKGNGKTALRVEDVTGTFSAGETVTYYDTDGTTVLATGTIETVDADGKFYIDAKNTGWELPSERVGKTVTANGDAQISSVTSKFGIGSLTLDGTGDYLSVASTDDFAFGTGDFTIEAFVYKTADTGQEAIFDFRTAATDLAVAIGIRAGNQPYVYVNGTYEIQSATALTLSAWNHVAYVRQGTTGTLYLNGTSVGTWVDSTNYGSAKPLIIGAGYTGGFTFWTGNIDEVRVINGTAKYTANFTPSTTPFLSEEETVLLLHFDDISGSTTIVDDGIVGQDIRFSGGATANKTALVDLSDFGAEIRLIGSASVYGNYGLVGDGPGVIMYAIGHNVAYIGNGGDVDNDPNTIIQANEVVDTNNAKIYYSTVDHKGDFRVGDLFVIDQENGAIQFSNASFNIDTTNGIEITDGTNTTLIKGDKIETGNWRLSGNTLETVSGDANITSASDEINFQNNVNITGNLDVVGDVSIAGNVTIGDQNTDSISFAANINSGMFPTTTDTYDLGSSSLRWKDLWANRLKIDNVEINDNYIEITDANANLELRANGTGIISIPANDVQIDQNLTVVGTTTITDLTVNNDFDLTGDLTTPGDIDVTGSVSITETLSVDNTVQFEDIQINQNYIETTLSNSDLELRANGTGEILIPNNDVQINNNLTVSQNITTNDLVVINEVTTPSFTTGDIVITTNTVTTTLSNSNLELRANGTGEILVPSNDVFLSQDLTVNGTTNLKDTNIVGSVLHTGSTTQTGNLTQTGNIDVTGTLTVSSDAQFEDIGLTGNVVSTTLSNSDLELRANGTGNIVIPNNDVVINNNLSVQTLDSNNLSVTNEIITPSFTTGDINISANTITTTLSNSNLELRANATGEILIPSNDVVMSQNVTVNGTTSLSTTNITGTITHNGDTTQTGNLTQTGNIDVTGTLTVSSDAQFEDISLAGNVLSTTLSNSDLEFRANGTGNIVIPNNNVTMSQSLTVNGSVTTGALTSITSINASSFNNGDIEISGNLIETTLSNSNLALRAADFGIIEIDTNDVVISQDLTVSGNTTLSNTTVTGTLTHTGNTTQTGDITLTGNLSVTGLIDVASAVQLEEILIDDNVITTTTSNADLELRASGTGDVLVPLNNVVIQNTATVNGQLSTQDIINTGTITSPIFTTGNATISTNTVAATLSNSDLVLSGNGTGIVSIPTSNVLISNDLTVSGTTTLSDTVVNGNLTQTGNYTLTGDATITGNTTVTGLFTINSEMQFENILINDNTISTTQSNSNLELRANGTGGILIQNNDVSITNNLTVGGTTATDNIINSGTITSNIINTDDLNITGNTISVASANTDLIFNANGTGVVRFENSDVNFNSDLNVSGTSTLANTNITGTLTHVGNTTQTGNLSVSNNVSVTGELTVSNFAQFEDIKVEQNFITTTLSNSNLELDANGTGIVSVPLSDVELSNDLTVLGLITSGSVINTGTVTSDIFSTGDIAVSDNTISTTLSNSNLELRANGTGIINIPNNNVSITNNLDVSGLTTVGDTTVNGNITHVGDTAQTGDVTLTGNLDISDNLTVGAVAQFNDIRIETNFITTTVVNSDLILRANGTGIVSLPNNDLDVTGNLTVSGDTTLTNVTNTGTVTSNTLNTTGISITTNSIAATQTGSDLQLSAVAGSIVSIPSNDVVMSQDLTVNGTATLGNTNITGTVTHTGDYIQTGNTTIDGDVYVTGNINLESEFQFEEININDNIITTTSSNADLDLRANGIGEIVVPSNDVRLLQDLTVEGTLFASNLISSNTVITSNQITTGDIVIQDNFITTSNSNSDLELRASGTGSIDLGTISFSDNNINVLAGNDLQINLSSGNNLVFNSSESIVLPVGTTLERPATPIAGMVRFNSDISDYEGYDGTNWKRLGGVYDIDQDTRITAELTTGSNDGVIRFYSNGTLVSTLDEIGLTTPKLEVSNVVIENSTISTVTPNTSITLESNGTGSVNLENFAINGSTITNTLNTSNMTIVQNGTGYLKFGDAEGFVIPTGNSTQRPAVPEVGVTRFNTDDSRVEVYDGQNWVSVAGSQSGISRTDAEDLALQIVLSLG